MKNPFSLVAFLNDQNTLLVVTCLGLQFRSVGFGRQWIFEGLNCVRFLFKFVTWKIGPLSHLNDIFLSYFLLCFHASLFTDTLWSPAEKGLTSWLSFVMSNCEVVTFPLVSWVRCGAWLYRFLIFVLFLTFMCYLVTTSVNFFYFMHNPVFEHSDTLSFDLLDCIILHINDKQFRCSVFTFVQYITYTAITDLKWSNGLVNRCILLINWVSLCPFYQQ